MGKNVNRNEVSANNVVMNNLDSIFERASGRIEGFSENLKAAMKAAYSLNKVIKLMKQNDVWAELAPVMAEFDFTLDNFGVKSFREYVHPAFIKVTENKEGEKQTFVCSIRKKYETETVYLCNESGEKLCKEGTPRTLKQAKIDEDGEKVIKEYVLCKINTWSMEKVITVLQQSKTARLEEFEAAQLAANEKDTAKNEKAA